MPLYVHETSCLSANKVLVVAQHHLCPVAPFQYSLLNWDFCFFSFVLWWVHGVSLWVIEYWLAEVVRKGNSKLPDTVCSLRPWAPQYLEYAHFHICHLPSRSGHHTLCSLVCTGASEPAPALIGMNEDSFADVQLQVVHSCTIHKKKGPKQEPCWTPTLILREEE